MTRARCLILAILVLTVLAGCRNDDSPAAPSFPPRPLRLLALGDSYTAGEGLATRLSWPRQLADSLAAAGDSLDVLHVIAATGWTAADLRTALAVAQPPPPYDVVTLMIGANDAFQGRDPVAFSADFDTLLAGAAALAGGDRGAVVAVTIPDFLATPTGTMLCSVNDPPDLTRFDGIVRGLADERGAIVVDVTPLTRLVLSDPSLLARDGLHYSAGMYGLWIERLLPAVRAAAQPRGR